MGRHTRRTGSLVIAIGVALSGSCEQSPTRPSQSSIIPAPAVFQVTSGTMSTDGQGLIGRFDMSAAAEVSADAVDAPSSPANLVATVAGQQVTLSWNAANGSPTSYVIEVGSAPGLANLAAFDTNSTGTTFQTMAAPVGAYYIRVRARNAGGLSGPSNEASVTVLAASPGMTFAAPPALTGTIGSPFQYSFCQPAPAGANDLCQGGTTPVGGQPPYHFQLGSGVGFAPLGLSLGLNGILSGTPSRGGTSTFAVSAVDQAGRSVTQTVTMTIAGCSGPPSFAPSNVRSSVNGTSVTITWDASPNAESYEIQAGSSSGASNLLVTNTGSAATTLTATAPAGTYYVRLRGRNACGFTVVSSEIVIVVGTPPPAPPTGGISISPTSRDLGAGGGCTGRTVTVPITVTAPANMRWTVNGFIQNNTPASMYDLDKFSGTGPGVVTYTLNNPAQVPARFGSCDRTFTRNYRDEITFTFANGAVLSATFTNVLIVLQ